MNLEHRARTAAIGVLSLIVLSVSSTSAPQGYHSWGECSPLQTSTIAPPTSACDSPCPQNSCGPACNTIVYQGGGCAGDKPECGFELVEHLKTSICRNCTCNADPDDPRCISDGTIYRTGDASMWSCFN
jgi:hypothetical protein